jgi:hypothetical protein
VFGLRSQVNRAFLRELRRPAEFRLNPLKTIVLVAAVTAVGLAQTTLPRLPKTTDVTTRYGPLRFYNIELITEMKDRPCGFSAHITNFTGVALDDDPTFLVKISGLDLSGKRSGFEFPVVSTYVGNDPLNRYSAQGACPETIPDIAPDQIQISFLSGTPDQEDLAQLAALRARAARLKRLPLLASGSATAFIAADRKCAQQFQGAAKLEGLEKRKQIADLFAFGCGFPADSPVRILVVKRDAEYALITLADGKTEGKSGWVSIGWLK